MSFTEEEIDRLFDAHSNFDYVEVTGCNGFGQEFCVSGRIAVVTTDEFPELAGEEEFYYAGIANNSVVIDYGDVLEESEDVYRTSHSAIMFTIPKNGDTISLLKFYISKIINKKTNKVLYYEPEYYQFKKNRQLNYKLHYNKQLRHGKIPAALDIDGTKFVQQIGKPMSINGKNGIIYLADEVTPKGDILLYYYDCRTFNSLIVDSNSKYALKNGIVTTQPQKREFERQ